MKESQFITSNAENWQDLERQLSAKKSNKKLHKSWGQHFSKITNDLSYAQTFYKRRSVKRFLNEMATRLFAEVYAVPIKKPGQFWRFWKSDLPLALYEDRKALRISFIVFLLAALIGVFSTYQDPQFANVILGDGYIAMTEENIANGDPLAVYKDDQPFMMFIEIFSNNLKVSIFTFIGGLFFGLGTLGILFSNGVMLGTFQYYFARHDLLFESFLTVWQHGATEICAIIIAGGAGLTIGKHLLFPGTLPRFVAFRLGVTRGMRVLMGIVPIIFLAAFIESFITRHDELHWILRIFVILASFAFMIGYYVWLPRKVGQSQRDTTTENWQPFATKQDSIELSAIKTNGEILLDAISLLRSKGFVLMRWFAALATFWVLALIGLYPDDFIADFQSADISGFIFQELVRTAIFWWLRFSNFFLGFNFQDFPLLFPITVLVFAGFQFELNKWFFKQFPHSAEGATPPFKAYFKFILVWSLLLLPLFFWWPYVFVVFGVILPITAMYWTAQTFQKQHTPDFAQTALLFYFGQFFKALGLTLFTSFFAAILIFLLQSPILWVVLSIANSFLGFSEGGALSFLMHFSNGLGYMVLLAALAVQQISFKLFYFSTLEVQEGHQLRAAVQNIQLKKSAYGIEKSI